MDPTIKNEDPNRPSLVEGDKQAQIQILGYDSLRIMRNLRKLMIIGCSIFKSTAKWMFAKHRRQ